MTKAYTKISHMDENFNFVGAFVIKTSALQQRFDRTLSTLRRVYRVPAALELFYLCAAICHYTESITHTVGMSVSDPFAYIENTEAEAVNQIIKLDNCVSNSIRLNDEVSHYFMKHVMKFGRSQTRITLQGIAFINFLALYCGEEHAAKILQGIYMRQVQNRLITEIVASNVEVDINADDADLLEAATDLVLARLNKYN